MDGVGRLERIFVKRFKLGPMDERANATLREGLGLDGNANQRGRRQITLIQAEALREMSQEMGVEIPPAVRRANLLVSGIQLAHSRRRILRIGACRLLIHGETRPCERMDEAIPGLRTVMGYGWRGGCYGEVLVGGPIALGDEVWWEDGFGFAGL